MNDGDMTSVGVPPGLALSLSGGGTRAMAFHSGVLRYLAEQGRLEAVTDISTVSGGSLLIGLIFARSKMTWPRSNEYLDQVRHIVRHVLTTDDLQASATARLLFWPPNWRFLLSRANVMAETIASVWKIRGVLSELPDRPEWSINGTTAETGKRFRFKRSGFGDYELGYVAGGRFPLASAMAVSAAFPVGIGPLAIETARHRWIKRTWGGGERSAREAAPPYDNIHIYDGGVYDNLGIEPFYDAGRGSSKGRFRILVSDAGKPLERGFDLPALHPFRLRRLMDVMSDQTRALRVRGFVEYLKGGGPGAYLQIGRQGQEILAEAGPYIPYRRHWGIDSRAAQSARCYPTNLHVMAPEVFDLLENHGYEVALANDLTYPYLQGA
jgi:NTE family protein